VAASRPIVVITSNNGEGSCRTRSCVAASSLHTLSGCRDDDTDRRRALPDLSASSCRNIDLVLPRAASGSQEAIDLRAARLAQVLLAEDAARRCAQTIRAKPAAVVARCSDEQDVHLLKQLVFLQRNRGDSDACSFRRYAASRGRVGPPRSFRDPSLWLRARHPCRRPANPRPRRHRTTLPPAIRQRQEPRVLQGCSRASGHCRRGGQRLSLRWAFPPRRAGHAAGPGRLFNSRRVTSPLPHAAGGSHAGDSSHPRGQHPRLADRVPLAPGRSTRGRRYSVDDFCWLILRW
jgi:hypothetical protein